MEHESRHITTVFLVGTLLSLQRHKQLVKVARQHASPCMQPRHEFDSCCLLFNVHTNLQDLGGGWEGGRGIILFDVSKLLYFLFNEVLLYFSRARVYHGD